MSYKDLILPNEMILRDYINRIINIDIRSKKDNKVLIDKFLTQVKFYRSMAPYLQFMYTIKELKLDRKYKTYRTFITSFMDSPQYKLYLNAHIEIERAIRWSITLLERSP
jgi:hypothetical protein